jgi:hypothetical protein
LATPLWWDLQPRTRPQGCAGCLYHGGDHLLRSGLDLGVGQRPLARLENDFDCQRLLAIRQLVALIHVEQRHAGDQGPLGATRGPQDGFGGYATIRQEGEVPTQRLECRQIGWCLAPALRVHHRIQVQRECDHRSRQTEGGQHARMQLPETAQRDLGALPDSPAAARVVETGRFLNHLQRVQRNADSRHRRP